ncbi:MAG TPA: carboxypeptidase-like regulatory domain-containing protein [Thermoanaerobaculia bacterium]|nr:carboxypeptidase-like regulatory domain-containing protein [Thermoanaerobaculia bacterium]
MTIAKAALCAVALLLAAACGPGPTDPSDFEFGRIDVYAKDAAGQPVNGAAVRMERLNGQTEDAGGLTGSVGLPGYYFFLKTSGQYRIVLTPPAGYTLAEGQAASVQVTFSRNQTQTVNFALRGV